MLPKGHDNARTSALPAAPIVSVAHFLLSVGHEQHLRTLHAVRAAVARCQPVPLVAWAVVGTYVSAPRAGSIKVDMFQSKATAAAPYSRALGFPDLKSGTKCAWLVNTLDPVNTLMLSQPEA